MRVFKKSPEAELDYSFDWTDWLTAGEVIASSDWIIPSGLIEEASSSTGQLTVVWLSGGTFGETYTVTNRITTNSSPRRTDTRSIKIQVTTR